MLVYLKLLETKDEEKFIKDNQYSFKFGAKQYFSEPEMEEQYDEPGEIIARETIYESIHRKESIAYQIMLEGETWHGSTSIEGTYSIDYLIGEEEYLGKGFGKRLIQTLIRKVFNETDAERIIVQPDKDNLPSRNTLLSAGFSYFEKDSIFIITRKIKR